MFFDLLPSEVQAAALLPAPAGGGAWHPDDDWLTAGLYAIAEAADISVDVGEGEGSD